MYLKVQHYSLAEENEEVILMNKRLICLLLSLIMLLSGCLVSCSQKSDEEENADTVEQGSESTITLSMYLVSEKEVSEEQAAAIQTAVNKITKSKFKTQLILNFLTEDQYYSVLEKTIRDAEEAKAAREAAEKENKKNNVTTAASKDGETTAEETIINEYGVVELKYPSLDEYQVDIFYLSSYDKLEEYLENDWLSRLDDELTSSSKLLNTYVAPEYLKYMKSISNGTYAIPNNKAIGEYTYLLLNKKILNQYFYTADGVSSDLSDFTSLTCDNCKELLEYVSKYNPDYLPLKSFTGELDIANFQYWGIDENGNLSNEFSVFGGSYDPSMKYLTKDSYAPFANIFSLSTFRNQVSSLLEYKEKGYYGTEADADKKFAVGYVKGGAELAEIYGDEYEMVVVGAPTLNTADVFENMFAVSSYTKSVSRSMEIITYLNTNADFRNLIQYGIEGENYELVDSEQVDSEGNPYKVVRRLNDNYLMDINKTGNVLIAYPTESEYGNLREYSKIQNRDAKISLSMGFSLKYNGMSVNVTAMNAARELSAELYEKMMACQTVEELNDFFTLARNEVMNNDSLKKMMDTTYFDENVDVEKYGEGDGFNAIYNSWLIDNKIYVPDAEE